MRRLSIVLSFAVLSYYLTGCDPPTLGIGFGAEQFALIPSGTFQMGSTNGGSHEQPVHTVNITQPFYMQRTEVTQGQWREVMGSKMRQTGTLHLPVRGANAEQPGL